MGMGGGAIGYAESGGDWDYTLRKAGKEAIVGAAIGAMGPFFGAAVGGVGRLIAPRLAQAAGRGLGWLGFHEAFGGHTLARHVGIPVVDLLAARPGISGASSFIDQEAAEVAISRAFGANRPALQAWLRGQGGRDLVIEAISPDAVGYGVARGSAQAVTRFGVKVVLRKIPGPGGKFFILTAFPI